MPEPRLMFVDFSGTIKLYTDVPQDELEVEDIEDLVLRELQKLKDTSPEDIAEALRLQVDSYEDGEDDDPL